ncbi:hypothetical protein CIRG_10192 [Coccidioides immitis RMSCC 2394]|uniref:Uncharacterized protein n=1 Tax=Coccidioides immitis RMSCC 2394 TaxID=404692 RepID=A0A0J6Y5P5_COCIT|nr:hypothetical protein CIRG_10192 [Coccidioides immitis RMSCC 2394]
MARCCLTSFFGAVPGPRKKPPGAVKIPQVTICPSGIEQTGSMRSNNTLNRLHTGSQILQLAGSLEWQQVPTFDELLRAAGRIIIGNATSMAKWRKTPCYAR